MTQPTNSIRRWQIANDFGCLRTVGGILPSDIDAITERKGRFLILEVKHGEGLQREELSDGQEIMLKRLSALPDFDVLLVRCLHTKANEVNARLFNPYAFYVITPDAVSDEEHLTDAKDFARRYAAWCLCPRWEGLKAFTCPAPTIVKALRKVKAQRKAKAVRRAR